MYVQIEPQFPFLIHLEQDNMKRYQPSLAFVNFYQHCLEFCVTIKGGNPQGGNVDLVGLVNLFNLS